MISDTLLKFGAAALVLLVLVGGSAGTAWHLRGVKAERDLLAYQQGLEDDARLEREKLDLKRQADAKNLSDSSQRVDAAEQAQRVEVQYVDREAIKYRDRPVAGKCVLPVDWVRLYNQSGRAANKLPAPTGP